MTSQLGKQLAIGLVIGGLLSGGIWYMLGSKRDELEELKSDNVKLVDEVEKGKRLKASYLILKKEVEEQEKRIAELVQLLPQDLEQRDRVKYLVQKLASASALGTAQSWQNLQQPPKADYYQEHQTSYRYGGGFHEFGKFLSLASGYDKIINISDIVMTRNAAKSQNLATIEFRLSVFVYDPKSATKAKAPSGAAKPSRNEE
jgi:Tfp pilus assembly protein PilO